MRALLLSGTLAVPLAAQTGPGLTDRPMTRQDSSEARHRFEDALLRNPSDSRSIYWLARLTAEPDSVVALYRRYTVLEPGDAWGWMPLGDALLVVGQAAAAESAWAQAARLAPDDAEIRGGHARFQGELGRYWLRSGRPRRAERALERSLVIGDLAQARSRLALARAQTRAAVEPGGGYRRDSDGNYTALTWLRSDLLAADGLRLGVSGALARTGNDFQSVGTEQAELYGLARPGATTRLAFGGGLARTEGGGVDGSWTTATGQARFRWTAADRGPVMELSAQRLPLLATPELAVNQVVRSEARGLLDLPVGPIRLRGEGRAGRITAPGETNLRVSLDGAVVLPLGAASEVSLQAHRLGYRDTTTMGYFAPEQVITLELGSYLELGDAAPWSVAVDLGAGGQRIQAAGSPPGAWGAALRAWGWVAYALGPVRALQLEVEGSTAPGSSTVATAADWRYLSVSLSLRWAL